MEKQNKLILESSDFSFCFQCPVCNSTSSIELGEVYRPAEYKIKDNTVVLSKDCISLLKKCNSCGLIFLSLVTTTGTEKKLYSCWTNRADKFHRWKPANSKGLENIKSDIDRVTRTLCSEKNLALLDIGIGEGDFIELFNKDYKTFGVDKFVTPGVDYQSVINEKMLFYDIEEEIPKSEMRKFHVVTAFDIFEHFRHPQKAVKNIYEMLIDGGFLVVETGNINSFPAKIRGRNNWWYTSILEHKIFWSTETLTNFLKEKGFTILSVQKKYHKAGVSFNFNTVMNYLLFLLFLISPNLFNKFMSSTHKPASPPRIPWKDHILIFAQKK